MIASWKVCVAVAEMNNMTVVTSCGEVRIRRSEFGLGSLLVMSPDVRALESMLDTMELLGYPGAESVTVVKTGDGGCAGGGGNAVVSREAVAEWLAWEVREMVGMSWSDFINERYDETDDERKGASE